MNRRNRSRMGNLNAAVWLIGIGILWLTNLWWPGILIVIGVSMLVQALVHGAAAEPPAISPLRAVPPVEAVPEKVDSPWDDVAETPAFIQENEPVKNIALLPSKCPACGGPVADNAHKVEWMGEHSARCPFCNTVLTL
jgi:hypothetical protein